MAISTGRASRSTAGGVEVGIAVDHRELASILNELSGMPDQLKKAELAAVKRTTKTGKTQISKVYRTEMGPGVLNKKMVDARISLKFPSAANIVGRIIINNRGYPLHAYRGRPTTPPRQAGVKKSRLNARPTARWTVHKSQGEVTGRNHFVQRDKRGEVHIMVRSPDGRGGHNAKAPEDYRIKYGPGLVMIARTFKFEDKMILDLGDVLEKNLRSQVDRFLNRKKK
jgi:hypothetical protein